MEHPGRWRLAEKVREEERRKEIKGAGASKKSSKRWEVEVKEFLVLDEKKVAAAMEETMRFYGLEFSRIGFHEEKRKPKRKGQKLERKGKRIK